MCVCVCVREKVYSYTFVHPHTQTRTLSLSHATVPDPLLTHLVSGQIQELHDMPKMLNWIDGFRLGRLCAFFRESVPYAQVCVYVLKEREREVV